jgi:hypothetical protein
MWTALTTLLLIVGSLWFYNAPLESQANPLVTPLHVVAPWYLAWSQGWLKLADKVLIAFIFIPALATAFFVMPYIEVGKSRRYADRRIGLSVTMLFIAFMLVSNWMGSPEYAVESSPDQELFQELVPQEGHSVLLAVPYEDLEEGFYVPGGAAPNPALEEALAEFEAAMNRHSCNVNGSRWKDTCKVHEDSEGNIERYSNSFATEAMPDAKAALVIGAEQHNLKRITMQVSSTDPNSEEVVVDSERVAFRHADSLYEED